MYIYFFCFEARLLNALVFFIIYFAGHFFLYLNDPFLISNSVTYLNFIFWNELLSHYFWLN